jgi:hypothetical protein
MSKKWTKAQYGRERYLATEFVKSKSEQMTEGKLTEKVKYKKDKKIGGKWYTKQGTHKHQMKANVIAKREFGSKHYDAKVVKEKDGYTVYIRPLKEGKLTSEQKLRKVIREIIKEQMNEKLNLGGAYEKMILKHNDKIAQGALSLIRQTVMKKYKVGKKSPVSSEKVTRRLVATLINNDLKELRNQAKSPGLKKAFEKIINTREAMLKTMKEGKLTEAPQKGKHVVYYEKGSSGKKVLDVKPNYKSASLAMNKHMNTGKYNTVGIQHWEDWNKVESPKIKEGKLTEVKFKKVILPNDMKTKKVVSKMIKQLKLKIDKDYDVKALKARGGDQEISILPKHYNKFIELAMQNKLNPRG